MRVCDVTGKKIGFLERVYLLEDGRRVSREGLEVLQKSDDDVRISLNDSETSETQLNDGGYVEVTPTPQKEDLKWEFRVIKLTVDPAQARKGQVTIERFENTINKMGEDGWELCTVIPLNILLMNTAANHSEPALIFKRPKGSSAF